jgi:hypothetical protein
MRASEWIEHWKGTIPAVRAPQLARRVTAQQPTNEELTLRELLAEAHARIRALEKALDRLKTGI